MGRRLMTRGSWRSGRSGKTINFGNGVPGRAEPAEGIEAAVATGADVDDLTLMAPKDRLENSPRKQGQIGKRREAAVGHAARPREPSVASGE